MTQSRGHIRWSCTDPAVACEGPSGLRTRASYGQDTAGHLLLFAVAGGFSCGYLQAVPIDEESLKRVS